MSFISFITSLLVVCLTLLLVNSACGMDCSFLSKGELFTTCPSPLFALTNPEKSYCCPTTDGGFECCDLITFLFFGILIPLIIIGVILSLVAGCICCFCCGRG